MAKRSRADREGAKEALIAALVAQLEAGGKIGEFGEEVDLSGIPKSVRDNIAKALESGSMTPFRANQIIERYARGESIDDIMSEAVKRAEEGPGTQTFTDTGMSGKAGEEGFSALEQNLPNVPDPVETIEPTPVSTRSPEAKAIFEANKKKIAQRVAYSLNKKLPPNITYDDAIAGLEASLPKLSGDQLKTAQETLANLREFEKNFGITSKATPILDEAFDKFIPAFRVGKKQNLLQTAMLSSLGEAGVEVLDNTTAKGKYDPKYLLPSLIEKVKERKPLTREEGQIFREAVASGRAKRLAAEGLSRKQVADALLAATEGAPLPLALPERASINAGPSEYAQIQESIRGVRAQEAAAAQEEVFKTAAEKKAKDLAGKAAKPKPGPVANILGMLLGTDEIKTGARMLRKPGILPKLGGAGILGGLNLPGALLSGAVIGGIGSRVQQMTAPSPVRDNVGSLLNRARLQEYQRAEAQKNLMQNPDLMAALTKQLKGAKIARTGEVPGNTTIGGDPSRGTFQDPEGLVDLLAPKE